MKKSYRILAFLAALLIALPLNAALASGDGRILPAAPEGAVTEQCTVTMPEGLEEKVYRITDGFIESYQQFRHKTELRVDLPDAMGGLYLKLYAPSRGYTVEQLDGAGNPVASDPAQPYLNCYYPLDAATRAIRIVMHEKVSVSELCIYPILDALPADVQCWSEPHPRADLLISAVTPDVVLPEFSAVLMGETVEHGVSTILSVLAPTTRTNCEELLSALWMMGIREYPVFGTFKSVNYGQYKIARAEFGKKPLKKYLESVTEESGARVIVTHAETEEEAPNGSARLTGEYTLSAAKHSGAEKVYTVSDFGLTAIDREKPLITANGASFGDAVQAIYTACCPTLHARKPQLAAKSTLALIETTVGEDTGRGIWENIDTSSLDAYAEPTPTPEPTPVPTEAPAETPAPIAENTVPETKSEGITLIGITFSRSTVIKASAALALGLIATVILAVILGRMRIRRKARGLATLIKLLPLFIGIVLAAAFALPALLGHEAVEPAAAAVEATPEPTPEPTEVPAEEAVPEEAEDSAAVDEEEVPEQRTAHEDDSFYRRESDPEEVIIVDVEGGHWEYRTDTLSILIDRTETLYTTEAGREEPLVLFTANIRMRDVNAFRTVQADERRGGAGADRPWIISRRGKAVLMITGDNLVESDEQYKSVLIRDGIVFLDETKCDIMAMYPDATMKIYDAGATNADELLMDGVRDAFSFGPSFIRNGVAEPKPSVGRINRETNPRTGIGMIEPGHYVAIVCDGRQPGYSYGMSLPAFQQLFIDAGCVEAYNLDGGVSACMLFMGEQLNHHGGTYEGEVTDTYQRRIPDGLVWGYSEQVPSEHDAILNKGDER